ncbi:hypothetical protein BC830DRAFT_1172829 [Chytriomyces sp. MP71]|nr:hypothetical protein BC830DRAFT_1172829 [Chytriomyces sp. MP71]
MDRSFVGPNSTRGKALKDNATKIPSPKSSSIAKKSIRKAEVVTAFANLSLASLDTCIPKADDAEFKESADLESTLSLTEQQKSRIERLHQIFQAVHQSFKTLSTTLGYFLRSSQPEVNIVRWELISLAYTVQLCVKYEESIIAQGKNLLENTPDILSRLTSEATEPTIPSNTHTVLLLPAHKICEASGHWIWQPTLPPRILLFPTDQIASDPDLAMLAEHGEVFAELWKAYKSLDTLTRLASLHALLESLTIPPAECLPSVGERCAMLKKIVTLVMNARHEKFEKRLAKDLFCSDRFGESADGWIFALVVWKCVYDVHGSRLAEEEKGGIVEKW